MANTLTLSLKNRQWSLRRHSIPQNNWFTLQPVWLTFFYEKQKDFFIILYYIGHSFPQRGCKTLSTYNNSVQWWTNEIRVTANCCNRIKSSELYTETISIQFINHLKMVLGNGSMKRSTSKEWFIHKSLFSFMKPTSMMRIFFKRCTFWVSQIKSVNFHFGWISISHHNSALLGCPQENIQLSPLNVDQNRSQGSQA